MNMPTNGKTKTLVAIILYLALALYTIVGKPNSASVSNEVDKRVAVVETELKNIKDLVQLNRQDADRNRNENLDAHNRILDEIRGLRK